MSNTATLPCNTAAQCAFLAFAREAVILGTAHDVFGAGDRRALVAAIRAADVEMISAHALGVVVSLLGKSECEIANRCGRWHTAAYLNLRNLGRQALVIPAA